MTDTPPTPTEPDDPAGSDAAPSGAGSGAPAGDSAGDAAGEPAGRTLSGGSYDLLRRRLATQMSTLIEAAERIDERRVAAFGSVAIRLTGADRLTTELACTARDIARIGDLLLLGYNTDVAMGATTPEHVFALYRVSDLDADEPTMTPLADDDPQYFLGDPAFRDEFDKLYRFFGKAHFIDLRVAQNQLLAVFQVGDRLDDVRALRWSISTNDAGDHQVSFVDGRGERDYTWLPAHDSRWEQCTREDQRAGAHPVVSVLDEVFVGFRGGRLQLRVDTGSDETRAEIDERIDHAGQSLADLRVEYATSSDILLVRIHLYDEAARTYVFNRRTRTGTRVDAAGVASRVLPGGGGIVFPGGYHLTSTGTRVFDVDVRDMVLDEIVVAPNGEDIAYVFHRRETGDYLLMPYNLVHREVAQVIACHGFSMFANGSMVLFRGAPQDAEPARLHPVQWWQTPFADDDHTPTAANDDRWAQRVGNAALVAGLGDLYDLERLAREERPTARSWEAVAGAARRALDSHLWFADDATADIDRPDSSGDGDGGDAGPAGSPLHDQLRSVLATAGQLLDEHALVERRRAAAASALTSAEGDVRRVLSEVSAASSPEQVVAALGQLRRARGELSAVADIEGIDTDGVQTLVDQLDAGVSELSGTAIDVLSEPQAFGTLEQRLATASTAIAAATTAAELDQLADDLETLGNDLDAVVDTVSSLEGGDATVRTRIVRSIADVTGTANRVRASLDSRRRSLGAEEDAAAFDAELTLVEQTLNGSVASASTPQECDATLARLLVTIERLESRYGQEPDRVARIAELRSLTHETVDARRSALIDERNRRSTRLVDAAQRLLATVTRRASEFGDDKEVAAFFATDQLTARVRELADELESLGEAGRAAEVRGGLRDASEEARRRIRDKAALVDDDGSVVLGGQRLAPNTQPFEIVLSATGDGRVAATVTGTDFAADVTEQLHEYADLLAHSYPSETADVYRGEYLAWAVLDEAERSGELQHLISVAAVPEQLAELCQLEAERRHGDGYQRGVHDHDAARILAAVLPQLGAEPLMRFTGAVRGLARLWWSSIDDHRRSALVDRAGGALTARQRLGADAPRRRLITEIEHEIEAFTAAVDSTRPGGVDREQEQRQQEPDGQHARSVHHVQAATYLADELADGADLLAASTADALVAELRSELGTDGNAGLDAAVAGEEHPIGRQTVALDWIQAFVAAEPARDRFRFDVEEAAALLAAPDVGVRVVPHGGAVTATELAGDHPRIDGGELTTRLDELAEHAGARLEAMRERWPAYQAARRAVVARYAERVHLDEHRPKVMAGFVRNTLIDEAILPLFGNNLARQIGTVDPSDVARQGLLVVISPPGYGKTTLMEWIADRLGLLLVKVNGPALGHDTTSLDPADAPNATARAEVDKINLALRFGRNTMLYVDDIQHTNPVLLSRFIPLADATRRIEGVVDGEPTTFDLRGRRFCVVMAGNPYTSGGTRFEMPDMLVNRSDVHNLGDVSTGHAEAFARSYIENSITACPVLAPHASKLLDDLRPVIDMAAGRRATDASGLAHAWDGAELDASVRAVALLRRAQNVLLKVNAAYIASAATSDEDRTSPPFLLQGSYRNMARIAGRVAAVMTDAELDDVVDDHYRAEAQTLTDRAEQSLLAYRSLVGHLTGDEHARWTEIQQRWTARAAAGDSAGRVVDALDRLTAAVADQEPDA